MTTTARETAPVRGPAEVQDAGHVDVLIIGAGVSGIGVAHHLTSTTGRSPTAEACRLAPPRVGIAGLALPTFSALSSCALI
jgi:hypothetical protein